MKISTVTSIDRVQDFCKENFHDNNPFISYDFFKLLERSECTNLVTGWIPQHIILEEEKKIIGFIPNFKKLNSNGEYVFDHIFANAYHQLGLNYYPKFLSAIPFTPVNKQGFIYGKKNFNKKKIYQEITNLLKIEKVSSFHINFIGKSTSEFLQEIGFSQRIGIQYYWRNNSYENFESFLLNLKTKKRKNILKERNFLKLNKIKIIIKQGDQIKKEDIESFYKCYSNTIDKKWSIQYLKISLFFFLLESSIKKNMILIQAYEDKKFIGCSLHFLGNNILYGRYWGCLKEIPFLHFELCYYSAIDFAIKHKIKKIEAGAQGEHKISRGYIPELTYSNHWFNNKKLKEPINNFLENERDKTLDTLNFLKKYSPFKG